MNVIGFYNKGVRVVIPGAAGGIDRHRSFGGGGASGQGGSGPFEGGGCRLPLR